MILLKLCRSVLACLLICAAAQSLAATYQLRYELTDILTLTADIAGALQADDDTVNVATAGNVMITDTSGSGALNIGRSFLLLPLVPQLLSLSGTGRVNFHLFRAAPRPAAIGLSSQPSFAGLNLGVRDHTFVSGPFNRAGYSLTQTTVNPVPLPASGLLSGGVIAVLIWGRQRKCATARRVR